MDGHQLHALRVATKARIRELTLERAKHALAALEGDPQAAAAIDSIDAERDRLYAKLETFEQAEPALKKRDRDALRREREANGGVNWPRLSRVFVTEVTERRERAAFYIRRGGLSSRETAEYLQSAKPATVARELAERLFPTDATASDAVAAKLLAETKLPRELR